MSELIEKCIECENEVISDMASLQVDFYELEQDYKELYKLYLALNEHHRDIISQRDMLKEKCKRIEEDLKDRDEKLDIFRNDEYFENLDYKKISELAKKTLRVTANNRLMISDLEIIYNLINNVDIENKKLAKDERKILKEIKEISAKYGE